MIAHLRHAAVLRLHLLKHLLDALGALLVQPPAQHRLVRAAVRCLEIPEVDVLEFADHPLVGEVRGVGLLAGVEVMADSANRQCFDPAAKVGPKIQALCEENGLLIRAMGDTIGFCPPLIIEEATIEKMLAQFGKSLDQGLDWARQEGLV